MFFKTSVFLSKQTKFGQQVEVSCLVSLKGFDDIIMYFYKKIRIH